MRSLARVLWLCHQMWLEIRGFRTSGWAELWSMCKFRDQQINKQSRQRVCPWLDSEAAACNKLDKSYRARSSSWHSYRWPHKLMDQCSVTSPAAQGLCATWAISHAVCKSFNTMLSWHTLFDRAKSFKLLEKIKCNRADPFTRDGPGYWADGGFDHLIQRSSWSRGHKSQLFERIIYDLIELTLARGHELHRQNKEQVFQIGSWTS